jgi:hypothetical protein
MADTHYTKVPLTRHDEVGYVGYDAVAPDQHYRGTLSSLLMEVDERDR